MTKLDKKIQELILKRTNLKMQLNTSYGSTISILPSKTYIDVFFINQELKKLTLLRNRVEKIQHLKNKIKTNEN